MNPLTDRTFAFRALFTLAAAGVVAAALAMLWSLGPMLLSLFLGLLLGVLLDGLAGPIASRTGAPRKTVVIGLALIVATGGVGLALTAGPALAHQLSDLDEGLNRAVQALGDTLRPLPGGPALIDNAREGDLFVGSMATLSGAVGALLRGLAGFAAALIIAIFGAMQPDLYRRGFLALVPAAHRDYAAQVLGFVVTCALRNWVKGRAVGMLFVGCSMWVGLALLGLKPAGLLALIAGLCTFVPILGPWIGAVPAILLTLAASPAKLALLLVLFGAVQFLETNVVTPLAQQRAVAFPPALLIIAQLVLGSLAGLSGLVVATPLAVVLIVVVQALYVRGVLGEDIAIAGNPAEPGAETG